MNRNIDSLNSSYDDLVNELERGELTYDNYDKYKDLSDKDFFSFFLNRRRRILSSSSSEESNSEHNLFKSNEQEIIEYKNELLIHENDTHEYFNWEIEDKNNSNDFYNSTNTESEYEHYIIMKPSPKSKKRIFNKYDNDIKINEESNKQQNILEKKTLKNKKNDFINISIN